METETYQNNAEKLEKESEKNVSLLRENMIKIESLLNLSNIKILNIEERVYEKLSIKSDQLSELISRKENDEIDITIEVLEKTVERLLNERESLGTVNLRAEEEMNEMNDKIQIMFKERTDLEEAIVKLRNGIFELNKEGRERLRKSFADVNENFKNLFKLYF